MHVDHVGIERTLEHLSAFAGIEAEPAARGDIGALFEACRRFHPVASAIAQREFGSCWRSGQQGD